VITIQIPAQIDWFASQDWGFNSPGVIGWWACLADGHYHLAREYRHQFQTADVVAHEYHRICRELRRPTIRYVAADPSMWAHTGHGRGESLAETLSRCRLPMRKGDNDRKNGWQRVHQLLQLAPDGRPWLTIDTACTYLLRSFPALMSDRTDADDVDTKGDDHGGDMIRYGAMSRPSPTRLQTTTVAPYLSPAWFKRQQDTGTGLLSPR
jgi:hypothetical protein